MKKILLINLLLIAFFNRLQAQAYFSSKNSTAETISKQEQTIRHLFDHFGKDKIKVKDSAALLDNDLPALEHMFAIKLPAKNFSVLELFLSTNIRIFDIHFKNAVDTDRYVQSIKRAQGRLFPVYSRITYSRTGNQVILVIDQNADKENDFSRFAEKYRKG